MAQTRKLTVTSCEVIKKGTSAKNGREWTIYEVYAVDEAGQPIEAKLRAFDPLPLNELVLYTVEMRQDQRHGTSYTLIPPREHRAQKKETGYKVQIQELQARSNRAEQRLLAAEASAAWLLGELNALRAHLELDPVTPPDNLSLESQPTAGDVVSPALGAGGNAMGTGDIPF